MELSVLIPYAPADEWRELLSGYVRSYLDGRLDAEFVVGVGDTGGLGPSRFNHPEAINLAAASATGDVFLICDADTIPTGSLDYAIARVAAGEWAWSMPRFYFKTGRHATAEILDGRLEPDAVVPIMCDWVGDATSWAGVQIVRRADFELVRGWDERYIGWGSDDNAFGATMDTLVGPHVRYDGAAVHLWHRQRPADSHLHPNWGPQQELTQRYQQAHGDPERMQPIIDEKEPHGA